MAGKEAGGMIGARSSTTRGQGGFTLLELSIVMGIAAAVIVAIWTASAAVQFNLEVDNASDDLNQIVINVRALYAAQNTSALPIPGAPDFSGPPTQTTLIGDNIFPTSMLKQSVTPPTEAYNPWSETPGGTAMVALSKTATFPTLPQFVVRFTNIPAAACAALLVRDSLPGNATGLTQINITATPSGLGPPPVAVSFIFNPPALLGLPITPIIATDTACPGTGTFTIDWYYNLGST